MSVDGIASVIGDKRCRDVHDWRYGECGDEDAPACHACRSWGAHVAEAVLAHLRAVAADEGVPERVGRAVAKVDGFDRVPPGYDLLADAALAAFLGALAGERALPGVVGPDDEEKSQ